MARAVYAEAVRFGDGGGGIIDLEVGGGQGVGDGAVDEAALEGHLGGDVGIDVGGENSAALDGLLAERMEPVSGDQPEAEEPDAVHLAVRVPEGVVQRHHGHRVGWHRVDPLVQPVVDHLGRRAAPAVTQAVVHHLHRERGVRIVRHLDGRPSPHLPGRSRGTLDNAEGSQLATPHKQKNASKKHPLFVPNAKKWR